jgi:hypothetical protein
MSKSITSYPAGGPDWATVSRWVVENRPDLIPLLPGTSTENDHEH